MVTSLAVVKAEKTLNMISAAAVTTRALARKPLLIAVITSVPGRVLADARTGDPLIIHGGPEQNRDHQPGRS